MYKTFITVIDPKGVVLFEDYQLNHTDTEVIRQDATIGYLISIKIEEVEKINNQTTQPF